MGSVDLHESEKGYVELVQKEKKRLRARAYNLLEKVEALDAQLILEVCKTHGITNVGERVRIVNGPDSRPAQLVWSTLRQEESKATDNGATEKKIMTSVD